MVENIDYKIDKVFGLLVCTINGNKNHNFIVLNPIIYLYDNIDNEDTCRLFINKIYSHNLPEKLVPKLYDIFKNKNLTEEEKINQINLIIIES